MGVVDNKLQVLGRLNFYARILPHYAPDFTNKSVQEFWYSQLKGYNFDALDRALSDLCAKGRAYPTVGQIKDALEGTENLDDRATAIATQIQGIVMNYQGASRKLCEVGEEVVRRHGGWSAMGDLLEKDVPFKVKEWKATALVILRNPNWQQFNTQPLIGPEKDIVTNLLAEPCELKPEHKPESTNWAEAIPRIPKRERSAENRNLKAEFQKMTREVRDDERDLLQKRENDFSWDIDFDTGPTGKDQANGQKF
jgi:hypothetical protein